MRNLIDKVILPNGQEEKLDKLEKVYLIAKEVQKKRRSTICNFWKAVCSCLSTNCRRPERVLART
jgi:hypothetical protein